MTPTQVFEEIKRGKFRPVYYFYGEEDYRKTEAARFLLKQFLPDEQQVLNAVRLTAGKADFEGICAEISSLPMLGERRFISIDEIQKLTPTQQKKLASLLAHPIPEMVIVLSSPAVRTPKKNSAFFRDIGKIGEPVFFGRLSGQTARLKIESQLKSAGFTYDAEAVALLLDLTGGDFGGLTGELEKLSLSAESGSHIGVEQVKIMASSYQEYNIFELIDFVAAHKIDRALAVYNDLIQKGMYPVPIVNILSGHLVKLMLIHEGKNVPGAPFYVNKLRSQAGSYPREKLKEAIIRTAETDRAIRQTKVAPEFLVENLIREIAQ